MKSISVIINEYSRHTIELKDEYKLEEFIKYFEKEMRLVKRYRLNSPMDSPLQKNAHKLAASTDAAEVIEADC